MKSKSLIPFIGLLIFPFISSCTTPQTKAEKEAEKVIFSGNPFLPGDFADPCIIQYNDTFYVYATTGTDATVWYSADFTDWKLITLNWPTSMGIPNMWAPAVTEGKDGRFYMYYSLNSEIYAGVADHPKGPFRNLLPDEKPFIRDKEFFPPKIHTIDADCFIDDDGQAYLYWGSGWGFKDGVCAVGILDDDMCSFKENPVEITPDGYFEAPHLFKRNNRYYLMYSDGIFYDDTYKVRYAIADSPLGPFTEAKNSPVLITNMDRKTHGPGHNFSISIQDTFYIVYHKHELPLYEAHRQICIDKMTFDDEGYINPVVPTEKGLAINFAQQKNRRKRLFPVNTHVSSEIRKDYEPANAFDNNMGTLWKVLSNKTVSITVDLGKNQSISHCQPVFADIRAPYQYIIEYSDSEIPTDDNWETYYEANNGNPSVWPTVIAKSIKARHMRLTIKGGTNAIYGLWEWNIYSAV